MVVNSTSIPPTYQQPDSLYQPNNLQQPWSIGVGLGRVALDFISCPLGWQFQIGIYLTNSQ
jgi:hypothetical protein